MQTTSLTTHRAPPEPLTSHLAGLAGDPAAHGAQPREASAKPPPRAPGKPGEAAAPRNPGLLPAAPHAPSLLSVRGHSVAHWSGVRAAQPCWTLLGAGSQSQTRVGAAEGPQTRGGGEGGRTRQPRATAEFPLLRLLQHVSGNLIPWLGRLQRLFSVIGFGSPHSPRKTSQPSAFQDKVLSTVGQAEKG